MDAAHKADADAIIIRSAEPGDAARISAHLGQPGVFEGLLQMPDAPVASRLEHLQKMEPNACRLIAMAGDDVAGCAGLHLSVDPHPQPAASVPGPSSREGALTPFSPLRGAGCPLGRAGMRGARWG